MHGLLAMIVLIPREQQDIALPLVIPLAVVMLDIFAQEGNEEAADDRRRADCADSEGATLKRDEFRLNRLGIPKSVDF